MQEAPYSSPKEDIASMDGEGIELKSGHSDMEFLADPDWDGEFSSKHQKDPAQKANKINKSRRRNKLAKASRKKNRKK